MGKVNPSITYDKQELDTSHNACLMKKAFSKTLLQKPPRRLTFMVCIPGKIIEKFTCSKKNYDMNIVEKGRRLKLVVLWL